MSPDPTDPFASPPDPAGNLPADLAPGRLLLPKDSLPEDGMLARSAYSLLHDELALDGSASLNVATFVTTWMEPEAEMLMGETLDKNMIDKDEYPRTAEIERRCVNIVSDLFHAPERGIGSSAIGSSEAVMLCGMAMKWVWRARREAAGRPADRPNLVLGTNVQVVWEKFCRYWEVEPEYVTVAEDRFVVSPDDVVAACDENTIGVVAILGTTYTGEFEPIEQISEALAAMNEEKGWEVPLHVDAASGGFVAPFLHPDLRWDFRLPNVCSINASGHKYGLVYPGVGWAVWRSADRLPDDLVFHVNYLGGDMPTFTLNFSRPGNQIIGQYYNFTRYGRSGYREIMVDLQGHARFLAAQIPGTGPFEVVSDGTDIPVVTFRLAGDTAYTAFDISDRLRYHGWQVPAYSMPANAEHVVVLRVVVRLGMSRDMTEALLEDLREAVHFLESLDGRLPQREREGFHH